MATQSSIMLSTVSSNLSPYANSLTPDAKLRYSTKLLYNSGTQSLPDPYKVTEKWTTNPNTWPDLTFGDIYQYLIDTPSIYTKESMKAYKSLEAYNYVVSGHVQVILANQIDDSCPFIALKSKVTPSQRARDKPHEPWVYLEKSTGVVYCAHCTCMAGLGEVCSHIGALLFKVEMAVKMGLTEASSTSQACAWNSTFRKEVKPATVIDIFDQIKGRRKKEVPTVQATGSTPLPSTQILEELYALVPNAAFFTTVSTPSNVNSAPSTNVQEPKFPKLLSTLQDQENDETNIDAHCKDIYDTYSVTARQANNLEVATRNQAVSSLWYQHRMGRITASKAHDVLIRKPTTSPDNLVKRIAGYSSYDLSKKDAVRWGIEHEEECRQSYARHQNTLHLDFNCRPSGFVINPSHPLLGASPDGIVTCQCCGTGTLEIKCPYKHKDRTVLEAANIDKDFCLDSNLHLKTNHRYYTQVQLQMFLTDCQFCDFVVYTKCQPSASLVIVRVPLDIDFCNNLVVKCEQFMLTNVVKELITRQLENQPLNTVNTTSPTERQDNNNNLTYCICAEPEYGRMIKCDGEECPYEWFHYKCVSIRRKPQGQWFCVNCEQ